MHEFQLVNSSSITKQSKHKYKALYCATCKVNIVHFSEEYIGSKNYLKEVEMFKNRHRQGKSVW